MSATRATRRTTGSESARQIHASSPSPAGGPPVRRETEGSPGLVTPPPTLLAHAETRTRSGRVTKPPERYEPVEKVEDDYDADDYDTEDPDDVSEDIETDTEEEEDESDADEDGNLEGFVVADKSESDVSDSDGEPTVSQTTKRAPVKKRPAA